MTTKQRPEAQCHHCGERLGRPSVAFELESCGEPECERSLTECYHEEEAQREEAAREDRWGRY